jgi:hypothetical protein
MIQTNSFDEFAPKILEIYHSGKEEYWAAIMAPLLPDSNVFTMWQHRKIGMELMSLFKAIDKDAKKLLAEYSSTLGFDITKWKSLKLKDEYFRDAYAVYEFLVIWMDEQGLSDNLNRFGKVLRAVAYGVAGYGILDVIVDGKDFSALELITAQTLIAEYETRVIKAFDVTEVNLDILHQTRNKFLRSELKEKSLLRKASPYSKENPKECGYKAAHLLTPFMLSLEQLGKSSLIDAYFEVFFKISAVIQIIDDLKDLEDDLAIGHFSYVTLDSEAIQLFNKGRKPHEIAKLLLGDNQHIREIYGACKSLISEANAMLEDMKDPFLGRIVNITELRLDSFFRKELKMEQ